VKEVEMLRISMTKALLIGMTLLSADTALTQTLAGTETPVGTGTPSGVSTAATPYLLGGDDVLSINVVNFPALSQPQVTLMPDGKLYMQLLEPFSILGKTTTEVAQILTKQWKRYLINPSVRVSLLQKRKDNVLVYGFVRQPCTIEYKPPMRLLEALAQVGGPLPWADLLHVAVTHQGGGKETLDLSHPESRGATLNDVTLNAGDVVYIPGGIQKLVWSAKCFDPAAWNFGTGLPLKMLSMPQVAAKRRRIWQA
jgi:protein involved in polysaccharide export with SLBB domain